MTLRTDHEPNLHVCICDVIHTLQLVGEKVDYALSSGLQVIACIREQLEDREAGNTNTVVSAQVHAIASKLRHSSVQLLEHQTRNLVMHYGLLQHAYRCVDCANTDSFDPVEVHIHGIFPCVHAYVGILFMYSIATSELQGPTDFMHVH